MVSTDKPNPFQVLGLPADATNEDIVTRGQELCELAETEDRRLLCRWAIEQLITKSSTRLEYELFEVPGAQYEDLDAEPFYRRNRRNPVDLGALARAAPPPCLEDFNLATLIGMLLDGLLKVPETDLQAIVDSCPFDAGYGPPPLEVRDVIFG